MTKTDLVTFYQQVIGKYKKGEYRIKYNPTMLEEQPEIREKEFSSYALNYMIYEYMVAAKDDRYKLIIDVLLIPVVSVESMVKINLMEYKMNFAECDFEDFYRFMIAIKD